MGVAISNPPSSKKLAKDSTNEQAKALNMEIPTGVHAGQGSLSRWTRTWTTKGAPFSTSMKYGPLGVTLLGNIPVSLTFFAHQLQNEQIS